jgi:mono/diheme cytochrome c family protein
MSASPTRTARRLLAAWLLAAAPLAHGAPPATTRGELLYATHCLACHTTQLHWRDGRVATDWASLVEQVAAWQGRAGLGWSGDDIAEVARFLNQRYYGFALPELRAGTARPGIEAGAR